MSSKFKTDDKTDDRALEISTPEIALPETLTPETAMPETSMPETSMSVRFGRINLESIQLRT